MAEFICPSCGASVNLSESRSSTTTHCPSCRAVIQQATTRSASAETRKKRGSIKPAERKELTPHQTKVAIGAAFFLAILVLIFSTVWNPFASRGRNPDNPEGLRWNEGGTLHDKLLTEWSAGTERDQLATAANFAYDALSQKQGLENVTESEARQFAEEIVLHLNALSSNKGMHQMTVRYAVAPLLASKNQE